MAEFDKRQIINYIVILMTIGTFLGASVYVLTQGLEIVETADELSGSTGLAVGTIGGTILTALLLNTRDIYTYLFRKNPSVETT